MNRRLIQSLMGMACAIAPIAIAAASPAQAQSVLRPANDLNISIGRGQLVNLPGSMTDVFVANETIADVQVKSTRQLYVFGKAGGETTGYASNAAGDVIWSISWTASFSSPSLASAVPTGTSSRARTSSG